MKFRNKHTLMEEAEDKNIYELKVILELPANPRLFSLYTFVNILKNKKKFFSGYHFHLSKASRSKLLYTLKYHEAQLAIKGFLS